MTDFRHFILPPPPPPPTPLCPWQSCIATITRFGVTQTRPWLDQRAFIAIETSSDMILSHRKAIGCFDQIHCCEFIVFGRLKQAFMDQQQQLLQIQSTKYGVWQMSAITEEGTWQTR